MLRFRADENCNNDIARGLRRREPTIDIVRAQDNELAEADDPTLLAWAAQQERIEDGQRMPGVFEVGRYEPMAQVIEDLLLLAECSEDDEWEGQVRYLPL
jgi:hypothetical protein